MTVRPAWITGAGGLIGNYLVQTAPANWRPIGLTRPELELTNQSAVRERFLHDRPGLVIHCAAVSKSVACEKDPVLARKVNVEATEFLSELAVEIPFVLFSTDLVFDGKKGQYSEDDPVHPLSVYAETKAAAEQLVLRNPHHLIIRTSLNGGVSPTGDRSFSEELRRAWKAGETTRLFVDEFRSPMPAVETARATWELVEMLVQNPARPKSGGIYHVAGSERLSRWEIGQLIAARCPGLKPKLEPGSFKDYKGPPRAPDTSLNCAKAEAILRRPLPGLSESLRAHPADPF